MLAGLVSHEASLFGPRDILLVSSPGLLCKGTLMTLPFLTGIPVLLD